VSESERALTILDRLAAEYPNARCALDFSNPLELLVATILAAQARDVHINEVTAKLFPKYRTAADWADAPEAVLLTELKSTGFFNQKTKAVQAAARALVAEHGGQVPEDMDALTRLPGVGRKTANVVLGNAFGHRDRVAVDTHVKRLARRLGFTKSDDPEAIERDLEALWPAERRTNACHLLQFHGRRICDAQRPKCDVCVVSDLCPSANSFDEKRAPTREAKRAPKKKPAAKKPAAKKPTAKKPGRRAK
jgi:endonuclease-3